MPFLSSNKVKSRYQLKEKLGTGGMGVVYRARDTVINADIALKTLNDITDPVALRMFREECDKLAKIVHPNVVEIRDVGEIEDGGVRRPYLVMPFLRGRTLDSLILDSPSGLATERAIEILIQACRGLQATHDAGLIHRDIKPSNLFVLDDDSVKLIDFGVAHYSENLLTVTRKGTLMYMAPEQVTMRGISPLSDIFSLGVVAYEALTGRRPFEGNTEKALVDTILHRNPPPASQFNPRLNVLVNQTLQKALAKVPDSRFHSAREFGETLRKAALNQPIAIFDPLRIDSRLEQAGSAITRGDLELAGDILNQLEMQGFLDDRIADVKREFERIRDRRAVGSLLASARARIEAHEHALAAEKVEEALRIDPQNPEATALREAIERQGAEQTVAELLGAARRALADREFDRAKEHVEEALGICPNESIALDLRAETQRREQDFNALLDEKHRAARQAQQAIGNSDLARALELIDHALELDRQAPDPGTAPSDLPKQHARILTASREAARTLTRAQQLYGAEDFAGALACCEEMLSRFPEHVAFRSLKLDIEEARRQHTARSIAETERAIEAESDPDRRLEILRSAAERFPHVEHFAAGYRAALERREFIDNLVSKARAAEREHRPAEALSEWKGVASIHPAYPGVQEQIERLERDAYLQADGELRNSLAQQIRQAINACEFAGALHLLETAAQSFAGDREFEELRSAAAAGAERDERAGKLLEQAVSLKKSRRFDDALQILEQAGSYQVRLREIAAARHQVLLEQARSLSESDWRRAEGLLQQAVELIPRDQTAHKLLRTLKERERRERVTEASERVRRLQTMHDFDGALRAAEEALQADPGDPELLAAVARLKRRGDRPHEHAAHSPITPPAPPARDEQQRPGWQAPWKKAAPAARASGPADRPAKGGQGSGGRGRLVTVVPQASPPPAAASAEGDGGVIFSEKTPTSRSAPAPAAAQAGSASAQSATHAPSVRRTSVLLFVLVGLAVAVALILALTLPGRKARPVTAPARSSAPPVADTALLTLPLHLTPADAAITLDGLPAALHQGAVAAKAGSHLLEARAPGYKSFSQTVEFAPGIRSPLAVALIPLLPALRIETDFPAGVVRIDDKPAGTLEGGQFSVDAPAGAHVLGVADADGSRYFFPYMLAQNHAWSVSAPSTTAYGTPVLAAFGNGSARVVCGRAGLLFQLDGNAPVACTRVGTDVPAVAAGDHKLSVSDGSRVLGSHTIAYAGAPLLTAFVMTGAQMGGLVVQGNQDEFDVSVNGYSFKRPAEGGRWRRLFKPGTYRIAVSKHGFTASPAAIEIGVKPNTDTVQPVTFTPVPVFASLLLHSQPGTEVSIGGAPAGTVPESGMLNLQKLSPGPAELRLRHKGFADAQQSLNLAAGENGRTILLQPLLAKVSWTVDPPDAQVSYAADGSGVEHPATGGALDLPAGTYRFEATAPGRLPDNATVTVAGGESKSVSLRLAVPPTSSRLLETWPGWELQDGWLVRAKPGPVFYSLPEHTARVSFQTRWQRQKSLMHWSGSSLNLVFRTADNARSVSFRISDKGVAWNSAAGDEHKEGRFNLNLGKNPASVQAELLPSGVVLTVNGNRLTAAGPDLSTGVRPSQFGFILEPDQSVYVAGIRISGK